LVCSILVLWRLRDWESSGGGLSWTDRDRLPFGPVEIDLVGVRTLLLRSGALASLRTWRFVWFYLHRNTFIYVALPMLLFLFALSKSST